MLSPNDKRSIAEMLKSSTFNLFKNSLVAELNEEIIKKYQTEDSLTDMDIREHKMYHKALKMLLTHINNYENYTSEDYTQEVSYEQTGE